MKTRARPIQAAGFTIAAFLAASRAAGDPPVSQAASQEISPPPPRAMHRVSNAGALFLGVSAASARAVATSSDTWSVTGGISGCRVANLEWRSTEANFAAAIGGGRGGLTGQLDGRLLFGWRGYVTDWQGPFVRVGYEGRLFGSSLPFLSIPAGVVGYEVIDGRIALDVGLHGAFAESAFYGVYRGASRDVSDSPLFGAYAWMIAPPIQAGLLWDRLSPHDSGPLGHAPIDDVRTSACIAAGRFALLMCANLELTSGPAVVPTGSALFGTAAVVESISIGLGGLTSHAEAPSH